MSSMRKFVGVAAAASLAVWSVSPAFAALSPPPGGPSFFLFHYHHHHHHVMAASHGASPWPAFYIIGGAASVILDAAIVWNTQCRELTSQEAVASFLLPLGGILLDQNNNKCKR